MKNQKKKSFPRRVFLCLLAVLLAVCIAFSIYVSDYYHADPAAEDAMVSGDVVSVTKQNGNWVFAPESPTAGLIFYPGGKVEDTADLTDSGLRVYAAYGSEGGVLNREKYEADRVNLPQDTTETVIDGGCHAGFGSYSAQKGDGAPVISAEEQQQQTADALAAWMNLQ